MPGADWVSTFTFAANPLDDGTDHTSISLTRVPDCGVQSSPIVIVYVPCGSTNVSPSAPVGVPADVGAAASSGAIVTSDRALQPAASTRPQSPTITARCRIEAPFNGRRPWR